jgi:hypothetical protein
LRDGGEAAQGKKQEESTAQHTHMPHEEASRVRQSSRRDIDGATGRLAGNEIHLSIAPTISKIPYFLYRVILILRYFPSLSLF